MCCQAVRLFFNSVWILTHLHQSSFSSRKCKMRVVDLRNTGQNIWSLWSGASSYGCSSSWMAPVAEHRSTTKQHLAPMNVFIELCLKRRTLDNLLICILRWVEQRKSSIHLWCKKLKIVSMPMDNIMKVLSMVQLGCIQEVQVSCTGNLSTFHICSFPGWDE